MKDIAKFVWNMLLKQSYIATLLFFYFTFPAQDKADHVIGYYMSPEKNSIFKFYKSGDKYYGKSVWMKLPHRLDTLNPDKNKRHRKIIGSILVWDFIHDGKNTWNHGHIYNANTGKTYKAKITRDKDHNLLVRGYVGVQLIGKTEYFVKVDFKE